MFDFEWMSWTVLQSVIREDSGMSLLSIQSWKEMDFIGRYVFWSRRGLLVNSLNPKGIRVLIGNHLTQMSQPGEAFWTSPFFKVKRV